MTPFKLRLLLPPKEWARLDELLTAPSHKSQRGQTFTSDVHSRALFFHQDWGLFFLELLGRFISRLEEQSRK